MSLNALGTYVNVTIAAKNTYLTTIKNYMPLMVIFVVVIRSLHKFVEIN